MPKEKKRSFLSDLPKLLDMAGGTKTEAPASSGNTVENPALKAAKDYNFKQRLKRVARDRGEYDPEPGSYEKKKLKRRSN